MAAIPEGQQHPAGDWRTDVSWEYYYWLDAEKREENPDYQLAISFTDYSHNGSTPSVPTLTSAEDRQARMSMLEQVLQSSDWRAYLQQQIAFLDSGTVSMPEDERTVSREMYQLYLDLDIEPISFSMNLLHGQRQRRGVEKLRNQQHPAK